MLEKINFKKGLTRVPEVKEKLPELNLTFLYSPHVSEKDGTKIKESLENIDVYCPEAIGWTEEKKEALNKISQGEKKVFFTDNDWWNGIFKAIYNSKKIIWYIDTSAKEEEELDKQFNMAEEIKKRADRYFYSGELEKAIKSLKQYLKEDVSWLEKREQIMINNLKKLPAKIVAKYPKFKNKKKIKVLITLGSFHTWLYHRTKNNNYPIKVIFNQKLFIYDRLDQLRRSLRFKKHNKFNKEFYARIFIEDLLFQYLSQFSKKTTGLIKIVKIIASKVNFGEIEKLSEDLKRYDVSAFERPEYVSKFLRKKGINIPASEREVDKIINDFSKAKIKLN